MRYPIKIRLILLIIRLLGLLPLPANHALGGLVGRVLARVPSKTRRSVRVNLELCFPDLAAAERKRLLEQSLIETARSAIEIAYFWTRPPETLERLIQDVHGQEVMDAMLREGRGLIVAVPHLGAWELLGLYWARRVPLNSLFRPPRHPEYEALLTWARQRTGAQLLPATASGVRRLYKALVRHEVVAILPDQAPPGQGVFAPFFGQPAKTMTLLSKFAAQSGAPVLLAFAERLPHSRGFRIHLRRASPEVANPDMELATAALNADVEECVRIAPAQYQWTYRRFRRQPEGRPDPYAGKPL